MLYSPLTIWMNEYILDLQILYRDLALHGYLWHFKFASLLHTVTPTELVQFSHLVYTWSGPSAGFWKGGAREGLVGDCGIVFPVFQVMGGDNEKVSLSGASHENFGGILCEKSRFYANNHIFSNFRGVPVVKSTTSHLQWIIIR